MAKKVAASTKRVQVDKAKTTLLLIVAGAAFVVVFALIASKSYFSQANYLSRVAGEKEDALNQLKDNEKAVTQLVAAYEEFASKDPNILNGRKEGEGELDGDNARLILDALPSKYDFPALTSSVENLIGGRKIKAITGTDDILTQEQSATSGTPIEIPFTADVEASYQSIQELVNSFERSIRPFHFLSMQFKGVENGVEGIFKIKTYYQPEKDLTIQKKVVQ